MPVDNRFDDNTIDFRQPVEIEPVRSDVVAVPQEKTQPSASKTEIILTVAILLGFLAVVYLLLQRHGAPKTVYPKNSGNPEYIHQLSLPSGQPAAR